MNPSRDIYHSTERLARLVFARFDPLAAGVSVGVVWGAMLALATMVLVVKGGETIGPNLGLLSQYLPGYRVTWGGAVIGFLDAGLLGFGFGFCLAKLNNLCLRIARVVIRSSAELKAMEDWPY